jgi:hypothetical protein
MEQAHGDGSAHQLQPRTWIDSSAVVTAVEKRFAAAS